MRPGELTKAKMTEEVMFTKGWCKGSEIVASGSPPGIELTSDVRGDQLRLSSKSTTGEYFEKKGLSRAQGWMNWNYRRTIFNIH